VTIYGMQAFPNPIGRLRNAYEQVAPMLSDAQREAFERVITEITVEHASPGQRAAMHASSPQ
jgi:hypothetical protein